MSHGAGLTIREVVARTGVSAATLRVWESRHGFPVPARLPGGHRRYSLADVEQIAEVARAREEGVSLPVAIGRARDLARDARLSVFRGLRRRRPELAPYLLPKSTLIGLSHAIEDECFPTASAGVVVGSFQCERFYRRAESRWRELTRPADLVIALADFARRRDPDGGPTEIPIDRDDPIGREWSVICEARDVSVCLSASERPGQDDVADGARLFDTVWTIEPAAVREAVRIGLEIASHEADDLAARAAERLTAPPPPNRDHLRLVSTLTNRMVAYVGAPTS